MNFVLNDYKPFLTDEEILSDIKQVALNLNVDYISINTYKKYGKFSQCAIQNHFGTWKHTLSLANLRTERTSKELKLISDEEYFSDVRRVANLLNSETVKYNDYKKYGKYSAEYIFKRFSSWKDFLVRAKLKPTGFSKEKIPDEDLFAEIERMWIELGRQPTSTDIIKTNISKYSIDTFKRRFGGWRKTLEAFVSYINLGGSISSLEISDSRQETQKEVIMEKSSDDTADTANKRSKKSVHITTRNVNARLRYQVLKRDHYKCCSCGASPAKGSAVELEVDHIIPWADGGETVLDNLQTLCSICNNGKSNIL